MDAMTIVGGRPLEGTVEAGGSKNAALPILAATLLVDGECRLDRVPQLHDVVTQCRVLRTLGMNVRQEADTLRIWPTDRSAVVAPACLVRRMRASFCVLGPLLARRRRAVVALPGGCAIGRRPVDLHLKGLATLGAEIRIAGSYVVARAARLVGREIDLAGPRGPTVTGTANVLCAAVLARGRTTIYGAACEPEIVDLGHFLNQAGASVRGLGTPVLEIDGVDRLDGACHHAVIPDRIEAATLLIAAAVAGGSVRVERSEPRHMQRVLDVLHDAGAEVSLTKGAIAVSTSSRPRPLRIVALPYPGIPSDVQAQLTVLASLARGTSYVQDRVFPNRFAHVAQLARMGAVINRCGSTLRIRGVDTLRGAAVVATDLRASAALVLAALAAEGTTTLLKPYHLDRGYENLAEKLQGLGARVARRPQQTRARGAAPLPVAQVDEASCRAAVARRAG